MMARFCAQCGADMVDNAAFCPKCGKGTGVPVNLTGTYPAKPASTVSYSSTEDNISGVLAYLLIPALLFLFLGRYKRNNFVRFHSLQAILLWIVFLVLDLALAAIPVVNLFLLPVIGVGELVIAVICIIKAFQGEFFRLPFIGNFSSNYLSQQ